MRFQKNRGLCAAVAPVMAAALLAACGGEWEASGAGKAAAVTETAPVSADGFTADAAAAKTGAVPDTAAVLRSLEEFAELERSGSYIQGLGIAESGLRENIGDYAGAVAAAYKELALAYGRGLVKREALEQGLGNVIAQQDNEAANRAAQGILAFTREHWGEAGALLRTFFDNGDEPDSFGRWMILVCALETDRGDKQAGAAYRAIRARYAQFPEYWYRGARAFSGAIAAEYAERCVALASSGPFAAECRDILASFAGLKPGDGALLKSKSEIEDVISRSVSLGDPELLSPLMPLISLPENPYTVYALGALRALASVPEFRNYFSALAAGSTGRLAERLAYICRG